MVASAWTKAGWPNDAAQRIIAYSRFRGIAVYVDPATIPARKPVTVPGLHAMKAEGRRITVLTAYDYSLAAQVELAGIDVALVGDSLGMVVQGHKSTLPVTLEHIGDLM